jgi:hypothetical protein
VSDFFAIENFQKWKEWVIEKGAEVEIDGLELALTVENNRVVFMNPNEFIFFCKGMKLVMELKK